MLEPGRGYASIKRVDRRRAVSPTANVDAKRATPGDVAARVLPEIRTQLPEVLYTLEGQQAEQRDTLGGLARGFPIALLIISWDLHTCPSPKHLSDGEPLAQPPGSLPPARMSV